MSFSRLQQSILLGFVQVFTVGKRLAVLVSFYSYELVKQNSS